MAKWIPSPNFLPGSTDMGSVTTDTHKFTGSVNITGSLTLNGEAITAGGGGGGGGIAMDGTTANGVLTRLNSTTASVESNFIFDGSTLTVTGDVTASSNISASAFYGDGSTLSNVGGSPGTPLNSIQFNDASSFGGDADFTWDKTANFLALTGTLSISGSSLEVSNGDIKVSSSAQYTVEGGSDTFVGLMKFYNTSEGEEQYISGAVWNISQERVELRNFGLDTGYKSFAIDTLYADGGLQFIGGNMTIGDGNIMGNASLRVIGAPATFGTEENTTLKLETGYKSGEATGVMHILDQDETIWSAHSISGTLINGALTATGSAILGNASTANHQVSGTLHVSGGIMQQQYFSASISTPVNATCSLYNVFNYHLTANSEVTASSPVAGTSYLFFFRQDGTGTRTVDFSGFKWPGGTAPTLSTDAGAVDIVSGISDGTYIYADTTKDFS